MNIRLHILALATLPLFSFTTSPQMVTPAAVSKALTVSMQQAVTETFDLDFQSTSATGEFLSASGSTTSRVMARGTKSRTFYYRDTATGIATITVTATGRTSKQSFSASQDIIIAANIPTIKASKPVPSKSTYISPSENMLSTTTMSLPAAISAVIYSSPPPTDALADFLAVPAKMWHWILSIF